MFRQLIIIPSIVAVLAAQSLCCCVPAQGAMSPPLECAHSAAPQRNEHRPAKSCGCGRHTDEEQTEQPTDCPACPCKDQRETQALGHASELDLGKLRAGGGWPDWQQLPIIDEFPAKMAMTHVGDLQVRASFLRTGREILCAHCVLRC